MLYEIHMIKNYPPTNLNRDDTGAPKSCVFGGVQRGRISSQCQKRSWRTSETFTNGNLGPMGIRTRKLPELVCEMLTEKGIDESYMDAVKKKVSGLGNKEGKENDKAITTQIIFYSKEDIEAITEMVLSSIDSAGSVKEFENINAKTWQTYTKGVEMRPITLDIALFGRMVTSDSFEDVEAAMQVGNAISTHKMSMESDYFTAIDDMVKGDSQENSGAGMVGDIEFNSCCYYFYAAIDTDQLKHNLRNASDPDNLIKNALPAIIEAMAYTNPTGKQNSFAGHVLPEVVSVEIKNKKVPVNYANAFAKPAKANYDCSITQDSVKKLIEEIDLVDLKYGLEIEERLWFALHNWGKPKEAKECEAFSDLLNQVSTSNTKA